MIRDFIETDEAAFMEMADRFYSSDAVVHGVDRSVLKATFDAAISDSPFIRGLMIELDQRLVGFGLLAFSYATEIGGTVVLIEDLFIDESCRGRGIGGSFFEFLWAQYPDAKRFRLELTPVNARAQHLYELLGFEVLPYIQMVKETRGL